jgi:MFS family permease|tara:strand:+ start:427 stop:780 length:354 start_codon:yes stop_codon:yes gene_type:complete
VCAVLCALPLPVVTDYKAFVKLTWFLLFFGGFILPPVTGVMVNSVAETKRPQANSVAQLSYSLLGYLPGPIVYGFVASVSGQRYALGVLVYSTIISIGLLNYGIYLRILRDKQDPLR